MNQRKASQISGYICRSIHEIESGVIIFNQLEQRLLDKQLSNFRSTKPTIQDSKFNQINQLLQLKLKKEINNA